MRVIPTLLLLLALMPAPASAVTIQQVVALSKAGVSDEVVLALIDRDKTIFAIDPDQLIALKREGLSETVVLAMLRSGRQEPPVLSEAASAEATRALPTEPILVIVGHGPDRPNTYHSFDTIDAPRSFGYGIPAVFPYGVPYGLVAPSAALAPSCGTGRRTVFGSRAGTTGQFGRFMIDPSAPLLNDGKQQIVNNGFLPPQADTIFAATNCAQVPANPRGHRGR